MLFRSIIFNCGKYYLYYKDEYEKKTGTRNETHVVEQSEFPVYEGIHEANLDVTDIHYDKKFQIYRDD